MSGTYFDTPEVQVTIDNGHIYVFTGILGVKMNSAEARALATGLLNAAESLDETDR